MKSTSTIYLVSIFLILFGCGKKNGADQKNAIQHNFVSTFEGKINDELPIIAKLESKDNVVTGKYRYKNQSESLDLQGKFYNGDSLELKEFNKKGSMTGTFTGTYVNGKIAGSWSNAMGTKQMPFYLLESNTNYEADLATSTNVAGKYGNLEITITSNNTIHAVLAIGSYNCEMGDIEGDFKLIKPNTYKGQFLDYDNEATYLLKFNENTATLSQSADEEQVINGVACTVDGTYKK